MKFGVAKETVIKAEAQRRIEARYPMWKQMNIHREGGAALEAMSAFIDAIRSRSNKLEAMTPVPPDLTDDRWWVG